MFNRNIIATTITLDVFCFNFKMHTDDIYREKNLKQKHVKVLQRVTISKYCFDHVMCFPSKYAKMHKQKKPFQAKFQTLKLT